MYLKIVTLVHGTFHTIKEPTLLTKSYKYFFCSKSGIPDGLKLNSNDEIGTEIENLKKNYSSSLHNAIRLSKSMASRDKHATYGVSHLVLSCLLEDTGLEGILESLGKDVAYIQDWFEMRKEVYAPGMPEEGMIIPDQEVLKVMEEAERSKLRLGTDYIDA